MWCMMLQCEIPPQRHCKKNSFAIYSPSGIPFLVSGIPHRIYSLAASSKRLSLCAIYTTRELPNPHAQNPRKTPWGGSIVVNLGGLFVQSSAVHWKPLNSTKATTPTPIARGKGYDNGEKLKQGGKSKSNTRLVIGGK